MSTVRNISCKVVTETVRGLFLDANTNLGEDVSSCLDEALSRETSEIARYSLEKIKNNALIARDAAIPLCQDTGLAVLFVEVGQDVHIVGGDFNEAIQEGVRQAYGDGFFRKSVCDPLTRKNTGDNTPAVVHTDIVPGNTVKITVVPKGGGSENMSRCFMLLPADGIEGIMKAVVETVAAAGPNPCPPLIVGIGIGGTLERSAILAKKALICPVGDAHHGDTRLQQIEEKLLEEINDLGIGPHGYGGRVTALAVRVEMEPCHIASLPVTINLQCHAARHKEAVI